MTKKGTKKKAPSIEKRIHELETQVKRIIKGIEGLHNRDREIIDRLGKQLYGLLDLIQKIFLDLALINEYIVKLLPSEELIKETKRRETEMREGIEKLRKYVI